MTMRDRIKFVGTGGVFDYSIGNSSVIITTEQGNVLIDCGYTVYQRLDEKQLIESIDYLMITHLHGDHVGSIHPSILTLVNKYKKRVKIIYPTKSYLLTVKSYLNYFLIDTEKYIDFVDITLLKGIGFVETSNAHVIGMPSYSYYFEFTDGIAYFSGDVGKLEFVKNFVETSDKPITIFHETSFLKGTAHVYYKDLEDFSRGQELYAYHCNHLKAPQDCCLKFVANEEKFLFV